MYSRALRLCVVANRLNNFNRLYSSYSCERVLTLKLSKTNFYYDQQRQYKNFGHKPDKVPRFSKIWYTIILFGVVLPCVNYDA